VADVKTINLVRDVLDKQLVDKRREKMGKVDGIVLEMRAGRPPRLAYVEVGPTTLARRLHPRLARWVEALERRWLRDGGRPYRIPWEKVAGKGVELHVDLYGDETPALAWERALRARVVERLPGGGA
jgi:sporulation protein YlmC with PRC-barrel domain